MAAEIEHVVVLMLENRSFDHVFGARALERPTEGIDGVDHARFNLDRHGQPWFVAPLGTPRARVFEPDTPHDAESVALQMSKFGGVDMGGFVEAYERAEGSGAAPGDVMKYLVRKDQPMSYFLADHFTICQTWFSPLPTQTIPNRLFSIAGSAAGLRDNPSVWKYAAGIEIETIFDHMGGDYRVYAGALPLMMVVRNLRDAMMSSHLQRLPQFFEDARSGELPPLSWIEPTYSWVEPFLDPLFPSPNDDHPPTDAFAAQRLLLDVYAALRANEARWKKTVLVILYDEHGGFYDHVTPPPVHEAEMQGDGFGQRGPRVPAMVISPYAPAAVRGSVLSGEIYDHCSLLKFICEWRGIEPFTARIRSDRIRSVGGLLLDAPRTDTPQPPELPQLPQDLRRSALRAAGAAGTEPEMYLAPGDQATVLDDLRLRLERDFPADFERLYPELVGVPPVRRRPARATPAAPSPPLASPLALRAGPAAATGARFVAPQADERDALIRRLYEEIGRLTVENQDLRRG
jgi:phospholipase C